MLSLVMNQACWVYITTTDTDEASRISRALIEGRLAACTNILPSMQSVFFWENRVEHESEAVLIAKTRMELIDELTAAVKEVHSYTVPCVIALPIVGGNPDFIQWIFDETRNPGL